eukprot:jgi/Botrbrau1/3078/Bobra.0070s0065.1
MDTTVRYCVQRISEKMAAKTALEREKATVELHRYLKLHAADKRQEVSEELETCISSLLPSEKWEERWAGLNVAKALLQYWHDEHLRDYLLDRSKGLLDDTEVRVRLATGSVLEALAKDYGLDVWQELRETILGIIERDWDRDGEAEEDGQEEAAASNDFVSGLLENSYRLQRPGVGEMRHGTEGWRCLETAFKALQHIIEGCEDRFQPAVTPSLRDLIYRALLHPNRFVRETCYHILASLCRVCAGPELEGFAADVAEHLQDGLSENWSQVRYAACVAVRAFMEALGPSKEQYYPVLLPHLCFNRYDIAEGVRSYSNQTWQLIMGNAGREWVARYIIEVVEYYARCSKTNNHTVREAACVCFSELVSKIDKDAVRSQLPTILRCLITCLRDDSWPVRDAACLASAKAALAFPEEVRYSLDELYPLWLSHLDDNIYSVREDAAVALGDVIRAYGPEAVDRIMPVVRSMLPKAREQAPGSMEGPEPGGNYPSFIRVVPIQQTGRALPAPTSDSSMDAMFMSGNFVRQKDTGGIDYSCGCMDYGFRRDREAWEASDGAVYMIRELAGLDPAATTSLLPDLADIARLDHFENSWRLRETIWKQLPKIAERLGKKAFKPYLEDLIEPMFRSLTCGQPLCQAAAGACIAAMRDFLGPSIWAGRLTPEQQDLMMRSPDVLPRSQR